MSALLDSLIASAVLRVAGPGWLHEARAAALAQLRTDVLPTPRMEAWKYTALRALDARRFDVADATAVAAQVDAAALALPGVDGPRLVFANGVFRADLSTLTSLPTGLTLSSLVQELERNSEALRPLLVQRFVEPDEAFARLNMALANDGALMRVAPGVHIAQPVQVLHLGVAAAEGDVSWALRHVIEIGAGASLTLIERYVGDGNAHLGNVLTQTVLEPDARLHLVQVQEAATAATLIRRGQYEIGAGAQLAATTLELGGALNRHDVVVRLAGDRARYVSRGCFVLSSRQHCDTQLDVRHEARDTSCDLLWRGLADQRARGVFRGAITIVAGADGSAAALSNKNLLLSAHAEIDTQPVLEIHADEVQASHGATVGQLDERALFYLRSRGVPAAQAKTMLIAAFCRETLDGIENAALREHLSARLLTRLPHGTET
jgi:Fe-S cluster assembly protein SufD